MDERFVSRERLKKWLKIFAVFLVFMWVCTIISKSIYVAGLPRVRVQTLDKKYIEHVVEADGIVVAGGEQAVNVLPGLRVSGLAVQEGDLVEAGDLLFCVDLEDLTAMISDKEAELAKLQYHLSDLQFNQILESQKKEVSYLWAQEDYASADKETALAVERAKKALSDAESDLNVHLGTDVPNTSDSERQNAWNQYNNWKKQYYELLDQITAKEREIADLKEQIANLGQGTVNGEGSSVKSEESINEEYLEAGEKEKEEDAGEEGVNTDNTGVEERISTESAEISESTKDTSHTRAELEEALRNANEELEALQDALTKHERKEVSQPDYSAEELEYDSWQQKKASLQDAVQAAKQNVEDANYARQSTLQQKQREIASAEALAPVDSTASIYALEIAQLQSELAAFNSLKRKNGEVTAENGGFVSKIQIAAGSRTADTAAILLTDAASACQFKCSITKEQGKYLQLGDSLELKINKTGSTGGAQLEATVDYLTENALGGYDIVCRLPENIGQPGVGGSIRKSVQGELYSTVIPVEALWKEQEAYYIYTLHEKTGILGKELYVEKLKVRVADQNDTYAALEAGIVGADTEIITFCSEGLKQGGSVKCEKNF